MALPLPNCRSVGGEWSRRHCAFALPDLTAYILPSELRAGALPAVGRLLVARAGGGCDDVVVKCSTAITRLRDVADGLTRTTSWPDAGIVAGYVFGALIEHTGDLERVELALMVDARPEEVPWLARPAGLEAIAAQLRFDKLPLVWWWRSADGPVWNHHIQRAVRFWTAGDGLDVAVVDSLAAGHTDQLPITEPTDHQQLVTQLRAERDVSRRQLAQVIDRFYDRDWRRQHKHEGVFPQDHLWWAAAGFLELDEALRREPG